MHCYTNRTHDGVVQTLEEFMKASGLPVEKEVSNLLFLADPDNDSRIDLVVSETGKQRVAYDVQVVNNVALAQERNQKASVPGAQIKKAEAIKNAKYQAPCNDSGMGFKPLILASQGNFSETLSTMISQTIDDFSKRANIPKTNVQPYWTQRISVALQTGVARAQLHRMALSNAKRAKSLDDPTATSECARQGILEADHVRIASSNYGGGGAGGGVAGGGRDGLGAGGARSA
jgi:4-alpha-glucanotransferase